MKITVQVKTNSKIESVELLPDETYLVRVSVPPVDGKANLRVVELLAQYFMCAKKYINLISGPKSKKKIFEVKLKDTKKVNS